MANSGNGSSRDESFRVVDTSTERTSRACSLLFQSWMNLGSQLIVSSTKTLATTLEDLNEIYCDPHGRRDRKEDCKSDRQD
jgi:hypothetical protein